jgi:hypothetical protein
MGNSIPDGTPIELFKLRSLSGYIISRCGGLLAWKCIRQEQTAQSSAEAEIVATNECIKELLSLKNRAEDLSMADAVQCTTVFNDNKACVDWAAALTSKGIKHLNLRENKVREAQADGQVLVTHIPGQLNSSDLLTKELKDAALYRRLRDTIMVSRANFLRHHHCVPAHMMDGTALPYYSAAAKPTAAMVSSNCSVVDSTTHKVTQDRLARNASPPSLSYADVVGERSAALRAANHSRPRNRFATNGAKPADGQTVLRPSCQSLPSQGGVEVGCRKISSRQLSRRDSTSPVCHFVDTLPSLQ